MKDFLILRLTNAAIALSRSTQKAITTWLN